jgi:hypothetical protein
VPGEHGDPRVRDAVAAVAAACRRHDKLLTVGGMPDLSLVAGLGVSPLYLTGMDTDLLFSEACNRAQRFLAWHGGLHAGATPDESA